VRFIPAKYLNIKRLCVKVQSRAGEWIERVRDASYKAAIERVFVIRVDAFDWNCPQHIAPRFTTEELQDALAPSEQQLRQLEQENERLQETARAGWRTGHGAER
jgi:predicted RNA-binding protein with PIN domain